MTDTEEPDTGAIFTALLFLHHYSEVSLSQKQLHRGTKCTVCICNYVITITIALYSKPLQFCIPHKKGHKGLEDMACQ
jgi:hypothetical protein